MPDDDETCPGASEDMAGTHCDCWWDGEACHWCGAAAEDPSEGTDEA